jgi:hypothetical protein
MDWACDMCKVEEEVNLKLRGLLKSLGLNWRIILK